MIVSSRDGKALATTLEDFLRTVWGLRLELNSHLKQRHNSNALYKLYCSQFEVAAGEAWTKLYSLVRMIFFVSIFIVALFLIPTCYLSNSFCFLSLSWESKRTKRRARRGFRFNKECVCYSLRWLKSLQLGIAWLRLKLQHLPMGGFCPSQIWNRSSSGGEIGPTHRWVRLPEYRKDESKA